MYKNWWPAKDGIYTSVSGIWLGRLGHVQGTLYGSSPMLTTFAPTLMLLCWVMKGWVWVLWCVKSMA